MIWEITRSYRYDPETVAEGRRLYDEAIANLILKEIEKKNEQNKNTNLQEKTTA